MPEFPNHQVKANRKQTSVNMNNQAFDECVLLSQQIKTSFYNVQAYTKADMASSILKGLVTNDRIDRLRNGNQRRLLWEWNGNGQEGGHFYSRFENISPTRSEHLAF